ncbi:hypothetical protein [Kitasatospora indigofera]|uniref:hypothetical protein n=3 Tax=Kitasatospora indigofera TaxID=67307 RepID=UPI00368487C5
MVTVRLLPPRAPARPGLAGRPRPLGLPGPAVTTARPGRRAPHGPGLLPALLATCIGAVVLLVVTGSGTGSAPPRSSVLSAPIGGDAIASRPPGPGAVPPQQALVAEPLAGTGVAAGLEPPAAAPGPAARPGALADPAGAPTADGPAHPGPVRQPGAAPADPPPPAPSAAARSAEPAPPPSAPAPGPPAPATTGPGAPSPAPSVRTGPSPVASPDGCLLRLLFVCLS